MFFGTLKTTPKSKNMNLTFLQRLLKTFILQFINSFEINFIFSLMSNYENLTKNF